MNKRGSVSKIKTEKVYEKCQVMVDSFGKNQEKFCAKDSWSLVLNFGIKNRPK